MEREKEKNTFFPSLFSIFSTQWCTIVVEVFAVSISFSISAPICDVCFMPNTVHLLHKRPTIMSYINVNYCVLVHATRLSLSLKLVDMICSELLENKKTKHVVVDVC